MLKKIKEISSKNNVITFLTVTVFVLVAYKVIMNIEAVVAAIFVGLKFITGLLMPFIIGGVIAYLLNPAVNFFSRKIFGKFKKLEKINTVLSIITVYIITVAAVVLVLNMLIPLLITNIVDIANQIPKYIDSVMEYRNGDWNHSVVGKLIYNAIATGEAYFTETIKNYNLMSLNPTISGIVGGVMNATGFLLDVVFGVVISIYFILDKYKLLSGIHRMARASLNDDVCKWLGGYAMEAHGIFSRFIAGKSLDSLIIGIICIVGLNLLNVENSVLYGVIVGVTNMIPYFGPIIGAVPVVLLVLFESPLKALWVGLFIFALQQFDGMILGPKILGDSISLSPFWIIFAIIVGGGLFGVAGMFLGAPALAVIILMVNRLVDKRIERKEKNKDNMQKNSED